MAGCAPTLPQTQPERALVRDVARVVDVHAKVGWLVDEVEVEAVIPRAMKGVCQVPEAERVAALAWLNQQIAAGGGDVAAAWRARGKEMDEVEDLLLLTRTRLVLARADDWARVGRCPFWLEPTKAFRGVQVHDERLILTLEGGGRFIEEFALGKVQYGGGGSGRVLLGYGFAEGWALSAGIEGGGHARFTDLRLGEMSEIPTLVGFAAAPVVLRWQFGLTAHTEIEAGPMAYIDRAAADQITRKVEVQFDWGMHAGLGFGASYLRLQRGVIPRFTVALTVDYVPGVGGRPALTQVGIGARTGVDFSRWKSFE